jgi:hypothetical protein
MPNSEATATNFQTNTEAHSMGNVPEQFSQEISHDSRQWTSFGGWDAAGRRQMSPDVDRDLKPEEPSSKQYGSN